MKTTKAKHFVDVYWSVTNAIDW